MLSATIKGMLAHKLRLVLTATSIALGVAFLAGTLMLSHSMQTAFDNLFADASSGTDTVVRSEIDDAQPQAEANRATVPTSLLDEVRRVDGVAVAEGKVEGYALLTDSDGKPMQPSGAPALGTHLAESTQLRGVTELRAGRAPEAADEVAIDATSAAKGDLDIGSRVRVLFQGPARTFTVVGIVGYGDADDLGGSTIAYFEARTAQRLMGQEDGYDTIIAAAADGVSDDELADRVTAVLPGEVEAVTGAAIAEERAEAAKEGLGFLTYALMAFAGIALFVGSFIIWNTFSMQVAQRTRELALFRAIGATRQQVMRTILAEAVLLGVLASAIGIALGVAMARALSGLMGGLGFSLPGAPLEIRPITILAGLVVGTVITVVSATAPARRATKVLPVEALRDAAPVAPRFSVLRFAVGAVLTVGGASGLLLALFGPAHPAFIGIGVVGAVLGITTLAPLFMRSLAAAVGWPLRMRGVSGDLARQNAMRNPRRTASTAMALVIGLTMVAAVSVFAASLKASFTDVLENRTNADLYVMTPSSDTAGYSPEVVDIVRSVDGVDVVSPTSFGAGLFDGKKGQFTSIDPGTVESSLEMGMLEGEAAALTDSGVLVKEGLAEAHGWEVGDTISGAFPGDQAATLEVQGIYDGKGFVNTDYVISGSAHTAYFPDRLEGTSMVLVEDGARVSVVKELIADALANQPDATVMDQEEFQGAMGKLIDQLVSFVTVLLLLAVVIALLGIVNTLALSVFERTRELGLLRAVGMTRGQVRAMVRWESVIISVIGALLGAVLGIGLGLSLSRALADMGIDQIAVPVPQLLLYVVAAAVAGILAAVGPARRASKVDVLRAVVSE
ncbi:ABC transporter permease [Nocardioides astragali]|uniref:ABC transporter permease n=1 Tax=Nocardioides astragali TaxID=1776736 RepID=A0ABW2N931_9ACTN|nr:ABC transporter permease [Nocardioides astragali]